MNATKTEKNVEAPKVDNDFSCEICDFQSNRGTDLQVHMSRKHAIIELYDGNEKVDDGGNKSEKDTSWCDWSDFGFTSIDHLREHLYDRHQIPWTIMCFSKIQT